MNKILLGLNIVLLVAVSALFYLYIEYTKGDIHNINAAKKQLADSFKIAYFDIDTLENYYDYSKEVRSYLMKKDSTNQSQLSKMANDITNEIKQYNRPGTNLTQVQQSSFQQRVQEMQGTYEKTGNALAQALQTESFQKIQQVRINIQQFLKEYCKEKGYAYVLSTQEYDNIVYYKDTIRNITMDMVQKLNERYRKEHQK